MLEFVKKAFRSFFEVILWINLILWTVGGGAAGFTLGAFGGSGGFAFLGIIVGLIGGLLTNIVGGGFIATILNIDANLESIKTIKKSNTGNNTLSGE